MFQFMKYQAFFKWNSESTEGLIHAMQSTGPHPQVISERADFDERYTYGGELLVANKENTIALEPIPIPEETTVMNPYEFTSKTHSLSTEDLGKIFIDSLIDSFTFQHRGNFLP